MLSVDSPDLLVVNELLDILAKPFLSDIQVECFDDYKSKINEHNLEWLLSLIELEQVTVSPDLLLKIATALFAIDEVSEEALRIRVKAYRMKGNEAMARSSVELFKKKYLAFYNHPFTKELQF